MLQGAKLEVEAVVRETCEQILTEPGVPKDKLVLRAIALEIAAEAFLSVKKDGEVEEFVKVETPSSKSREAGAAAGAGAGANRPPVPPPRPAGSAGAGAGGAGNPPNLPPRPPADEGSKQETLHAAYKACQSCPILSRMEL